MSDDQRTYSDEQFALILRKAAELASRSEALATSSGGLTLAEIKAAAAQAGFDPALVERAARMVAASSSSSPLERLMGGPLRHEQSARFPIKLDETSTARLLSAVRINAGIAGRQDVGHSSALGMSWHDGGEVESLGLTARTTAEGTAVSATLDRRGSLGVLAMASGVGMFLSVIFSLSVLYPAAPSQGIAGVVTGIGGILIAARSYWSWSTKKVRERIDKVMDTIGENLDQAGAQIAATHNVEDSCGESEIDRKGPELVEE